MRYGKLLVSAAILLFCSATGAAPLHMLFQGNSTIYKFSPTQVSEELPADWSGYDFLVVEFRASSSQRFELGLLSSGGLITKRIHPFAGAWVRASIPLRFYRQPPGDGSDLAATMNQPRNSYWINIEQGGHGPIDKIEAISFIMYDPVGQATLDVRSVSLSKEDPGDALLEPKPIIDEFGQLITVDWPGKAKTLDELKTAWATEDAQLKSGPLPGRDQYGGYSAASGKKTGFFHVEQIDGKWWFIDPDGHYFFSNGSNGIGTGAGTRVRGREDYFTSIPGGATTAPADAGAARGGRGGRGGGGFGQQGSFYTANLDKRFGADWRGKWADLTFRRLDAWGLNTLSGPSLGDSTTRKSYVMFIRGWNVGTSIMGMPDVYADDFDSRVDQSAKDQLTPVKDDPYMIGYYIGNEPPWPNRESQLVDLLLAGPDSGIKTKLQAWLKDGDTLDRRKEFVYRAFEKYLNTIVAACKKYDSNHLCIGIRFGGDVPDAVIKMAKVFDVYSHNIYAYAPAQKDLNRFYELTGRPILIGEFHIGSPSHGLAAGLVQAANQTERGVAYRYYVEQAASNPAVIGVHWFQWLDQPGTGRNDGENYNIGIIDVTDRPYTEMVEAMKQTHQRLLDVHGGKVPPFAQHAKAN